MKKIIGEVGKPREKPTHRETLKLWYQRVRRLKWFKITRPVIIVVLVLSVGYLVFNLNIFYVEDITVTPLTEKSFRYIDDEEIEDFLLSYIGKRIFSISTSKVETDVYNQFAFSDEVYVSKRFPNKLQVRIVEREPVLYVETSVNNQDQSDTSPGYLIDKNLYVLSSCLNYSKRCEELPSCKMSIELTDSNIGSQISQKIVKDVIDLNRQFKSRDVKVEQFMIPESHVIIVIIDDSTRAIFSDKKDLTDQFDDYLYTRENLVLKGESYKEIDMRYDRPVVRVDKYTEWMTE